MKKHTTVNIDEELLHEAREALGTSGMTETIHRALEEVVKFQKRKRLIASDFPYLTPEDLDELRRERTFDEVETEQPVEA